MGKASPAQHPAVSKPEERSLTGRSADDEPQAHQDGQRDAALRLAATPAARPRFGYDEAPRPAMNRQERVIFTVYVVIGVLLLVFLLATGVAWWLGA